MPNEDTKQQWRWTISFNYFNVMDALITIFMTQHLYVSEAHPLMSFLLNINPLVFATFKIGLGSLVSWKLFKRKEIGILKVLTFAFFLIIVWNLVNSYAKFLLYGVR